MCPTNPYYALRTVQQGQRQEREILEYNDITTRDIEALSKKDKDVIIEVISPDLAKRLALDGLKVVLKR